MRHIAFALIAVFLCCVPPQADAARKLRDIQPTDQTLRLIVITAPGCVYCRLFRRDVDPIYTASKNGVRAPLVYIDVNDEAADELNLMRPVHIVPTVVLMDGDREVNRISGYLGPSNFFKVIEHMLAGQ